MSDLFLDDSALLPWPVLTLLLGGVPRRLLLAHPVLHGHALRHVVLNLQQQLPSVLVLLIHLNFKSKISWSFSVYSMT